MQLADDQFRLLVESIQDYAIYLIDPTGTVRSWNEGAQRLKGYTREEAIGSSYATFFTAADRANGKPTHLLAAALKQGRLEDSGWRVRSDGTQFWANVVLTSLFENGRHVGFAKITRDLTDRTYRAFVEATHAIVWATDAAGHPNSDSPTWREFTGQTEGEWRQLRAWEPVHPEDLPHLQQAWTAATASGQAFEVEFRLRRHDGVYVWMGSRAVPLRNVDGSIREWFGVTFDISARKQAQLERERAVDLLTTTLRSIGDAVIATDPQGRVSFMNAVAERLTMWTTDEARGRPIHDVFPIFNEATGAVVENPVDKVLREGATVGLANHTVLRRRDRSEIPIDDSAAPIRSEAGVLEGVVLVFRDATEEKRHLYRRLFLARATEEIAAADDYRDALRRIAGLACPRMADWTSVDVLEVATGEMQQLAVAHVDPAKVQFAIELAKKYPPDPNASAGSRNVVRTGRAELYPEIPQALLEAGARDDEHLRLIRELDLRSAMVVPLRGQREVFGALSFIFVGDTRRYTEEDLQLAEELANRVSLLIERRRLEEQAEIANRMKDEFLATISHELRTPLQAILGYGAMLERKAVADPDKALAVIMRNAHAQARLIEDMLDMSRILSGKLGLTLSRVDLGAAIAAAIDAVQPAAMARNQRVSIEFGDDLGFVMGDFERLQQIVWNLLANAVKFTPREGSITVSASRTGSSVRIAVRDTGRGISDEHLSAIFDRFRQVDSSSTRRQGGLGLGLAIVKYLTEAHGGTVTAQSEGTDQGSTFIVTLPVQLEPIAKESLTRAPRGPMSSAALAGVRVLLVDDDEDTRNAIADTLSSVGARVDQAVSAADALQRLEQHRPDVLVSDIGMPVEDGYALLRRVRGLPRERGGDIPAIALTAYARREDVMKAEASGFQLHVPKPVELEQLVHAIQSLSRPAR
ncbi:MAG TPA: PAS domain S-box protein [Kofleriaceae bacterium]|nr:PAS domain S-box protein [Kofleriaceae bacterium]